MLVQITVSRRKEEEEIGAWLPNVPWVTMGLCVTQCHSPTQGKKKAAFSSANAQEGVTGVHILASFFLVTNLCKETCYS